MENEFEDFMYNVQRVSKMTQFKLRPEWREGASDEQIRKKRIPSRGNSKRNGPEEKVG